MSKRENQESRKEAVERLLGKANILDVAKGLGFEIFNRESTTPKVRCPFHSDQRPSLTLYHSGDGRDDHFHCFSCSAHGRILQLIERAQGVSYSEALEWLARFYNESLPRSSSRAGGRHKTPRASGLEIAAEIYKVQSDHKKKELRNWAKERKLPTSVLQSVAACVVLGNELHSKIISEELDGEQVSQLEAAGMIIRPERTRSGESLRLPIELPHRDYFNSERVLFPIHDDRGRLTAFAGRAVKNSLPKYLFSSGFRKSETLYHLNAIRKVIRRESDDSRIVHLYIVEGILDVLRLKHLKKDAVAVLGNQITSGQVNLLVDFANDLERHEWSLSVHLFLDGDIAGRKGAFNSTFRLLKALTRTENLYLDVIVPPDDPQESEDYLAASPKDPDEWLKGKDDVESEQFLQSAATSVLQFLLSHSLGISPDKLNKRWKETSFATRQQLIRSIQRRFSQQDWDLILQSADLSEFDSTESHESAAWKEHVFRVLSRRSSRPISGMANANLASELTKVQPSIDARLIHAFQLAKNTKQNREAGVDLGSWERIEITLDIFLPYFKELLTSLRITTEYKEECRLVPFLIPKEKDEYRLKALPIPEILTLQQYFLNELLRSYPGCDRFPELIPAVRSSGLLPGEGLETTGPEHLLPVGADAVSFAYTVDMDVVNQLIPQKNAGAFVPYRQCWKNFLNFIDGRTRRFPKGKIYIARLDIRRYYNSIPRKAVTSVLTPAIQDALAVLESETGRHSNCLDGFQTELECNARGIAVANWLNEVSFGYQVENDAIFRERHNLNGLPQGPELSAYLANIALFPLDRRLSEAVHDADRKINESLTGEFREDDVKYRGAVYARYVDDMVIAASSASELNRLRSLIETELALLGMELSPKTDQLPPMDLNAVREWLTDQRGDGFAASGPEEETPLVTPDMLLPAQTGPNGINRKESLRLLYDINLVRPHRLEKHVLSSVKAALSARDLRYGEHVAATSILWRLALNNEGETQDPTTIFNLFEKHLRSVIPFPQQHGLDSCSLPPAWKIAAIDGIERVLSSGIDRNPGFSLQEQEQLRSEKNKLAKAVGTGLCQIVISAEQNDAPDISYHLKGKEWTIRRLAASIFPEQTSSTINSMLLEKPPQFFVRAFLSLSEVIGGDFGNSELFSTGTSSLTLTHQAIAALRSYGGTGVVTPSTSDPLGTLEQQLKQSHTSSPGDNFLNQILELWTPHSSHDKQSQTSIIDTSTTRSALMAFVNCCTSDHAIELLERRPQMVEKSLQRDGCKLIPNPPVKSVGGLMCIHQGEIHRLIRIDVNNGSSSNPNCVPQSDWQPKNVPQSQSNAGLTLNVFEHNLNKTRYLAPAKQVQLEKIPQWLASAYEELTKRIGDSDAEEFIVPPHALNLLGPLPGEPSNENHWGLFGYAIPEVDFRGQALNRGRTGLKPVQIPDHHSHLWRVGVALADWLNRYHNSHDLSGAEASRPASGVQNHHEWITEGFIRFSLFYLRGAKRRASIISVDPDTNQPHFVDRALKRLRSFPDTSVPHHELNALAHFFASLAEGRAFHAAYDLPVDVSLPGAAAAILLQFTMCQFRVDEELAKVLPDDDGPLPLWAPQYRPSLAVYCLSRRISLLHAHYELRDVDKAIEYVVAGLRLQCADFALQSLAMQLWFLLGEENRQRLTQTPPSISNWGLDGTALLTISRSVDFALEEDSAGNVEQLFRLLIRSTGSAENAELEELQNITSLGWLVIIGAACGQFDGDVKGDVFKSADGRPLAFPNIQPLISSLTFQPIDPLQAPWGLIGNAHEQWTEERLQLALQILSDIASKVNLRSEVHSDHRFYLNSAEQGGCESWTSDGKRYLPWWLVSSAKVSNEQSRNIETVGFVASGERVASRWSEIWYGDKLVGLGIVRPKMANLAGKQFTEADETDSVTSSVNKTTEPDSQPPVTLQPDSAQDDQDPDPTGQPDDSGSATHSVDALMPQATDVWKTSSHPRSDSSTGNASTSTENGFNLDDVFREIRDQQLKSWQNRSVKANSHLRVAFFQWEVDSSYSHPLYEVCEGYLEERRFKEWENLLATAGNSDPQAVQEKCEELRKCCSGEIFKSPQKWKGATGRSCAEFRRRKLLKRVLEACNAFDVQILLLPEYSIRPETVNWIAENQGSLAPNVAVWAGTYRLPPGMRRKFSNEVPAWSSVLEILPPTNMSGKRTYRWKKYPAVGADEVFHPKTDLISPLYEPLPWHNSQNQAQVDHSIYDPRAHAFELICSEAFLMTSPTNLYPVALAFRKLLQKFGIMSTPNEMDRILESHVQPDLFNLAMRTAHGAILAPRRTICLVPAMTSRAEDYTALGQAGYLASGITTVFCNAAESKYSNGSSCFIGHNGWRYNGEDEKHYPSTEPYHGVRPGIFQMSSKSHGKLGRNEQALVIADIDPINATEGKPRPQVLPLPLQLVAHLPVFEIAPNKNLKGKVDQKQSDSDSSGGQGKKNCRCGKTRKGDWSRSGERVIRDIARICQKHHDGESVMISEISSILDSLTKLDEANREWLDHRAEAYRNHHQADPHHGLPPALLDWLDVHIDYSKMSDELRLDIEMPRYVDDTFDR